MRRSATAIGLGVLGLALGAVGVIVPSSARFVGLGAGTCAIAIIWILRHELLRPQFEPGSEPDGLQPVVDALRERVVELENPTPSSPETLDMTSLGGANTSLRGSADQTDSLTDRETGLFSEGYFKVALDARIAAARRRLRPVSVVLVDVVRGLNTAEQASGDPIAVTRAIRATLREADTAARLSDGRFALVLEDTPENGAIWTIERLRSELVEDRPDHTVWAGVACYPAHAFDTAEILLQADQALVQAREWHQDRIEIASID